MFEAPYAQTDFSRFLTQSDVVTHCISQPRSLNILCFKVHRRSLLIRNAHPLWLAPWARSTVPQIVIPINPYTSTHQCMVHGEYMQAILVILPLGYVEAIPCYPRPRSNGGIESCILDRMPETRRTNTFCDKTLVCAVHMHHNTCAYKILFRTCKRRCAKAWAWRTHSHGCARPRVWHQYNIESLNNSASEVHAV